MSANVENRTLMENLNETEKAWLACALDGEGNLHLSHRKKKNGTWDGWTVHLIVSNTNMDFLKYAQRLISGKIRRIHRKDGKRKPIYELRNIRKNEILEILLTIQPYLIIKNKKAQEVISFLKSNNDGRLRK